MHMCKASCIPASHARMLLGCTMNGVWLQGIAFVSHRKAVSPVTEGASLCCLAASSCMHCMPGTLMLVLFMPQRRSQKCAQEPGSSKLQLTLCHLQGWASI